MVTTLTSATTFCSVALPLTCGGGKSKPNFMQASGLQEKRQFQACLMINGTSVIKKLLATRQLNNEKSNNLEINIAEPINGRLLKDGRVFQQNFTIRSFEIGNDFRISIETLMSYLQETALNHIKSVGILADGFGSTFDMSTNDLIWVVCWSHIEVEHYPSWDDVVQVNSWMYKSGRSGFRRDWHIQDFKTGGTVIRATSLYAMMNKKTRKLAKATDEAVGDLQPYFSQCNPIIEKDSRKLVMLEADNADYVRTGLTPAWTDIDVNQHVSHIKLVNYVLESVPHSVVETHELCAMTLEYRKECNGDSMLQSLSKVSRESGNHLDNQGIEFDHLLHLESGPQLVKGRTRWKPKFAN